LGDGAALVRQSRRGGSQSTLRANYLLSNDRLKTVIQGFPFGLLYLLVCMLGLL
jgi:hypothetical protein